MWSRAIFVAWYMLMASAGIGFAQELAAKEAVNYFNEGVAAQKSCDYVRSFTAYQKALLLFPQDMTYRKNILNNLGAIFALQGNLKKAELYLQSALKIDPDFQPAKLNLGLLYEQQPDRMKALEYWMKAFEKYIPKQFVIGEMNEQQEKK